MCPRRCRLAVSNGRKSTATDITSSAANWPTPSPTRPGIQSQSPARSPISFAEIPTKSIRARCSKSASRSPTTTCVTNHAWRSSTSRASRPSGSFPRSASSTKSYSSKTPKPSRRSITASTVGSTKTGAATTRTGSLRHPIFPWPTSTSPAANWSGRYRAMHASSSCDLRRYTPPTKVSSRRPIRNSTPSGRASTKRASRSSSTPATRATPHTVTSRMGSAPRVWAGR